MSYFNKLENLSDDDFEKLYDYILLDSRNRSNITIYVPPEPLKLQRLNRTLTHVTLFSRSIGFCIELPLIEVEECATKLSLNGLDSVKLPIRIGVVGTRYLHCYNQGKLVELFYRLPQQAVIVSGDCPTGVDKHAEILARERGMEFLKVRVVGRGRQMTYNEAVRRYHERNIRVVNKCNVMYAFPRLHAGKPAGGTKHTINVAIKSGVPVIIKR